jgi:formylglycine-generating enzyme required for sulfatase activity
MMRIATNIVSCTLLFGLLTACTVFDDSEALTAAAPTIGDPNPDGKAPGSGCVTGNDCRTGVCLDAVCQAASSADGVKNGDESDIDCGGAASPKCPDGKVCATDANCASGACKRYVCSGGAGGVAPGPAAQNKSADPPPGKFDDGIKNGTETDVDCGGPAQGPRCAVGKACKTHTDCESNGCTFDGKCAQRASCTQLEGGQTCGPNDVMTKQNDCCESAAVGQHKVDKYLVTAGRMRAFITRLDGKLRDWAAKLPADRWNQAHTAELPNSIDGTPGQADNVNTQLGPFFNKRSCETGYHTGHTYWTPAAYGDKKDFSKEVLDTKALNCVPWSMLAALCVFDGGHLVTEAELQAAYTNNGTTTYPWGARGAYTTTAQNDYAVQEYSYVTAGNAPKNADGFFDIAANIAPPGRRPAGYSATGHADLVGNLLEWVSDRDRQFIWKGSFESHAYEADKSEAPINNDPYMSRNPKNNQPWLWNVVAAQDNNPNGYYAIGGRCAY